MNETTNQSEEFTFDESDFADESTEAVEETAEESTASESEAPDTAEVQDDFSLGIRYNGQDMSLSREQAVTLAQKGMNYDKIHEQLEALKADPIRSKLEAQANANGLSLEEYVDRLNEFSERSLTQQIAQKFKAENPNVDDNVALQFAQERLRNQKAEQERAAAQKAQNEELQRNEQIIHEVQEFQQRFPDVDIQKLPTDVVDDLNQGVPLMNAWLLHENRELKTRLTNKTTNERNKANAVGKVSDNNGSTASDPFLEGLLG